MLSLPIQSANPVTRKLMIALHLHVFLSVEGMGLSHFPYWIHLLGLCPRSPQETQPPPFHSHTQRNQGGQGDVGSLWLDVGLSVCHQAPGWSTEETSHHFKQKNDFFLK